MDVIVDCYYYDDNYVTIPEVCRDTSLITGSNARPMQILATYTPGAVANGDFVAMGVAAGCVEFRTNTNGSDCSGIGLNGQAYKRLYVDGSNNGDYYLTWYDIVTMGSTHTVKIQREYVNGAPVWRHYLDGSLRATTHQGDTMLYGSGVWGVEAATGAHQVGLSMEFHGWSNLRKKYPNQGFQSVPSLVTDNPHYPSCYLSNTLPDLDGYGRC